MKKLSITIGIAVITLLSWLFAYRPVPPFAGIVLTNVVSETVCETKDGTDARFFAEVENGIVLRVIVAQPEVLNTGKWGNPNRWVETCYGDKGNRKNYAGTGHIFDKTRDAFISPKPYESWELDETTAIWKAPKVYPTDGKRYKWDELNTNWKESNE